jgi:sigma-B regulation protein RsbU (phosphoserine phosphatase)
VDIQSALDGTLKTLLKVMGLPTGWVTMLTKSHIMVTPGEDSLPHGFKLVSSFGLPPGLERDDCRFLRQPPVCRCQQLLMQGRLNQAVNVVECSRLHDSASFAGDNHRLLFHASVPLISKGKPLGMINVASMEWQFLTPADLIFLTAVSEMLVVAIERANHFEIADGRRIRLEKELQDAREGQESLIPRVMPDIPGFHVAGAWRPAQEIGGDFYDIFPLNEGRWGIMIGDVAGKGTAAALYMAMIRSLILSGAVRHHGPAEVLEEVNHLVLTQRSSIQYVTVVLIVLDPNKQTLQYANAGHNPPILQRASGEIESLTRTGTVVGVWDDLELGEVTIKLEKCDIVVMYSDGVTDALNPNNNDYGIDRLTAAVAAGPRKARELLAHIEADLNAFTQGALQSDDVTLFILTKD